MSGRKREPVAVLGAEDYRIVKHTHDIELAKVLMRAALGDHSEVGCDERCYTHGCPGAVKLGQPKRVYVRQQYCLDSSFGAGEGWAYHEYDKPGRGAFPAVAFR